MIKKGYLIVKVFVRFPSKHKSINIIKRFYSENLINFPDRLEINS